MKKIQLGICLMDEEGGVMSTRKVNDTWVVDLEQDLNSNQNEYVLEEISNIMTDNLTSSLKSDLTYEMLNEIKDKNWA